MQDFFSRYKLSMRRMYTYHTMICYTVGFLLLSFFFSISIHYVDSFCLDSFRVEFWKQPVDCSAPCFVISPSCVSFCSHINSIWSLKKRHKKQKNKTTKDRKETPSVSLPHVSRMTVQLLLCHHLHHHHRRHRHNSLASGGRREGGLKICPSGGTSGQTDGKTRRREGRARQRGREKETLSAICCGSTRSVAAPSADRHHLLLLLLPVGTLTPAWRPAGRPGRRTCCRCRRGCLPSSSVRPRSCGKHRGTLAWCS